MKSRQHIAAHVTALALFFGACGREEVSQRQGGISGGGGYLTGDAEEFLYAEASRLAQDLEAMPLASFQTMPDGWTGARFANAIRRVHASPDVQRSRDGRELMFDYGWDDSHEPYIEALRPFFLVYGTQSALASELSAQRNLRRRLLHETMHLLGANEQRASDLASTLLRELDDGQITCAGDSSWSLTLWPGARKIKVGPSNSISAQTHMQTLKRGNDGQYDLQWSDRCSATISPNMGTAKIECPEGGSLKTATCNAHFRSIDFR